MKSLQALAVCLTAVAAAQLQPVPLHKYDDTATYLTEHYSDHGNAYDQGRVPQAPPAWHPSDPVRVTATTKLRVHELPTSNTLKGPVTKLPWQKQNTLKKFDSETLDVSAGSCSHVRCVVEKHTCSKFNKDTLTWAPKAGNNFNAAECDGTEHYSLRVMHHNDETHCLAHQGGHHCALGARTGDTSKCECRPAKRGGANSWGAWGAWGECSATCGAGTRTRHRTCNTHFTCVGDNFEDGACTGTDCPCTRAQHCSGRGTANGTTGSGCTCTCDNGYTGASCQHEVCTAAKHCSGRGTASGTTTSGCTCNCPSGYTGDKCQYLQYLPSVEVVSGKTATHDDATAYVTCPSTHPTMTSCACDRESCDGAYIQKVGGVDRCHAFNAAWQSGVKARAICVVGTYATSQVSGSKSGGHDDATSKVSCPSGTTLTGCACYSPWIKCENAHANGNQCIAYNRGGGAGVYAKAQCVAGFQTTTHRRTGGHGTTNANSACANDEFVVGCQCSSAWQGCGGMGKRNEMLGSHSCQAYGSNTWADAMCAKVPARAVMKEVTSGKTGTWDDATAYVTCPSTHPTMTSCACDRESCDGAYIQKVGGVDRCHAFNASGQGGVKAKAICVVGTYATSQVSGSKSGGHDDATSKVSCPSGTTLTGCACYSPWIKCENAHANGNQCIAYNRGGGAGVYAHAQCVSSFKTTTHRRTGGHGTNNAKATCNTDEFVVGCQCSSAWQGCGGEWKRNEVNGHTCQVYGSNTWADVMCAKV